MFSGNYGNVKVQNEGSVGNMMAHIAGLNQHL